MQEAIAVTEPTDVVGPLDEPGITFTPTGLQIEPWVKYEQWERYGRRLQVIDRGIQWAVGDWIVFGEDKFGEDYAQAVEVSGLKVKTIQNYAVVARAISRSRRRDSDVVDFSTHAEVASLKPTQQDKILAKAEKENLTVKQVRREASRVKREDGSEQSEIKILQSPEVRQFLAEYIMLLQEEEQSIPLTAPFLRNMLHAQIGQAQWQLDRTVAGDCEVIYSAIEETGGLSDDDLFNWLQARGYFMRDPEMDDRLLHMVEIHQIVEEDQGGKQETRRGKMPSFWVPYYKKRPKVVPNPDWTD